MKALCLIDDIAEESARGFELEGHSLVAVKKDGQLYLYLNWCPHLGIELNFQPDVFMDMDNEFLQCANHGALFRVEDGDCLSGPCKGLPLQKVPFQIENGQLMVDEIPSPPDMY